MATLVNTGKEVKKLNNKLINILSSPYVKYTFIIYIVYRLIYINSTSEWYLKLLNSNTVKIIYALSVAYSACFDPVYAIALTTYIIICIQELNIRKATKNITANTTINTTTYTTTNNLVPETLIT